MKKEYTPAEFEIIEYAMEDVICATGDLTGEQGTVPNEDSVSYGNLK